MTLTGLFDYVCAQDPERTWFVSGQPLIVCQRCLGIYAGSLVGALLAWFVGPPASRSERAMYVVLILQLVPFGLFGLPSGLWARYVTGALFGVGVARLASPSAGLVVSIANSQSSRMWTSVGFVFGLTALAAPIGLSETAVAAPALTLIVVMGALSFLWMAAAAIGSGWRAAIR